MILITGANGFVGQRLMETVKGAVAHIFSLHDFCSSGQ